MKPNRTKLAPATRRLVTEVYGRARLWRTGTGLLL